MVGDFVKLYLRRLLRYACYMAFVAVTFKLLSCWPRMHDLLSKGLPLSSWDAFCMGLISVPVYGILTDVVEVVFRYLPGRILRVISRLVPENK